MIKILETEINFDFSEVENMAKFENALDEYMKELDKLKNFEGKESEQFMEICKIVYKLFDKTIGEGTSQKIFGTKNNFANCIEAVGQLIKAKEDSIKTANEIVNKYIQKEG